MDHGGRACVLRSHATTVGFNSAPSRLRWVSVRGGAASTISATYSADDLTLTRLSVERRRPSDHGQARPREREAEASGSPWACGDRGAPLQAPDLQRSQRIRNPMDCVGPATPWRVFHFG